MSGLLLDTSVVIAGAEGVSEATGAGAISVVTLGELRAGVKLAREPSVRAARQARLVAIRATFAPLPVDELVAVHYGDALAGARLAGRITKATDLLILATAAATGRLLVTLDERQAGLARELGVAVNGSSGS